MTRLNIKIYRNLMGAIGGRALTVLGLSLLLAVPLLAQTMSPRYYNPGTPALTDIWVDPLNGNDDNSGAGRSQALRSLDAAWNLVPSGATLTTTGYRIQLVAGVYTADLIPGYMERRYGTYACPVIIQAADGQGTATLLRDLNIFDCRYLYLVDFSITTSANNLVHGEACAYMLMHGLTLQGDANATQETIKLNQCQYIYLEDSDVSGAFWMAVDFFAVQYGHIVGNRLHNADWVVYLKGGSAYFRIEANEIYDGGTIGFTAGQGSGFEFMVSPWLHYEAADIKFINNVIHDIDGAGMGVNGGYNILLAHNTLYRVGRRSHAIEVVFGERGCDGDTGHCAELLAAGGWGTVNVDISEPIPNRHVYVYNNIIYNPAGYQSADSHLAVYAPRTPSSDSNIPSPAETDTDLRFRGNIFCNGPSGLNLGIGEDGQGGQASNPTCNPAQFRADNTVNSLDPQLLNPAAGDFRPMTNGNVLSVATYEIPAFTGGDRAAPPTEPAGNLMNTIDRDYNGNARASCSPPGAFIVGSVATHDPTIIGPVITANGFTDNFTVNSADDLSVTVQLNPGEFAGVNVDWWVVACAGSSWYYMDNVLGWAQEGAWRPAYQGALYNLPVTEVLNITGLATGLYTFYFAVDYPMDGILNLDGPILVDSVNVIVQ